jgi:hypothetical protein
MFKTKERDQAIADVKKGDELLTYMNWCGSIYQCDECSTKLTAYFQSTNHYND